MSRVVIAIFLAAVAWGCDTSSSNDLVEVILGTASMPVEVDTVCGNGGCDSEGELEFALRFDPDAVLPDSAEVEFLQYRIDYILPEIQEVSYFAGPMSAKVYPGKSTEVVLEAAGQKQRDQVLAAVGNSQLDGTATLTLAGYDDDDKRVFLRVEFDIRFGDFQVDDAP